MLHNIYLALSISKCKVSALPFGGRTLNMQMADGNAICSLILCSVEMWGKVLAPSVLYMSVCNLHL